MAKYRLSREDRTDFVLGHLHKKISLEDAVAFMKERIVLDEKKAIDDAWNKKGRQLLRSFKDSEGVRRLAAYNDSPEGEQRRMVYQMIDICNDVDVLEKQIRNMAKSRDGSDKLIKKVADRINKISSQLDEFFIYDFEESESGTTNHG